MIIRLVWDGYKKSYKVTFIFGSDLIILFYYATE